VEVIDRELDKGEIRKLLKTYGDYIKLTVDLEKELVVAGADLHSDGERVLLEKGCLQKNIWGGGIDLEDKVIDATAVLNLRSRMENDSMEILDPARREKFFNIVKKYFMKLWH